MENPLNNLPPVLNSDQKYLLVRYNTINGDFTYWSADALESDYVGATRMSLLTAIEIRTTLDSLPKRPNHALALIPEGKRFEDVVGEFMQTLKVANHNEN